MSKTVSVLVCTTLLWLLPGGAMADPYVGFFSGELDGRHYDLSIERISDTGYDGILKVDGDRMQLEARRYGERMSGRLRSHSEQINFRAQLEGGILVLQTDDGRRIILRPTNPE